jgi:glycosyltransferase involved in cell wall biosynthesis
LDGESTPDPEPPSAILVRVRVLHLVDRLTNRGGAYVHLLGVLEALSGDHDLLLATGRDEATARAPCPVELVPGLDERTSRPVALDELADRFQPDVVHLHNLMNPAVLEWAARRGDTVSTVQDHRYFCPTRGKWRLDGRACDVAMDRSACASCFDDPAYFEEVYALTDRRLRAVRERPAVVLSSYMKEELARAGVPREGIHVIPPFVHGLDLEAVADGPACVLFVGRLVETKGVRDAVEAWRRANVGLPLVLAGTGPLRADLREPGVSVLGWVERDRLARLYRRAHALLLPSRWQEPFGIVGLEALAFGVPVVAWDSGGVREWHPGPELVPWGDVEALSRALVRATAERSRPVLRDDRFDRGRLVGRLVELYVALTPFARRNGLPVV